MRNVFEMTRCDLKVTCTIEGVGGGGEKRYLDELERSVQLKAVLILVKRLKQSWCVFVSLVPSEALVLGQYEIAAICHLHHSLKLTSIKAGSNQLLKKDYRTFLLHALIARLAGFTRTRGTRNKKTRIQAQHKKLFISD